MAAIEFFVNPRARKAGGSLDQLQERAWYHACLRPDDRMRLRE